MTAPKLHTDALHRMAYATDASAYREMPLAVSYPKTEDDQRALIDEAPQCLAPDRRRPCITSSAGEGTHRRTHHPRLPHQTDCMIFRV